jgi:GTP-binding protein
MKIISAEFVKSAAKASQYAPDNLPEVAFVGRSNSGKSSLINTLTGHSRLAKTSNSPGRTQLIQFFTVNRELSFADLPGYGYAKVPAAMKESWRPMIETYLRERTNLRLVIIIADIRRDITDEERLLIDWLTLYGRSVILVLSKIDKLSRNEQFIRLKHVRGSLNSLPLEDIFPYSAKTGEGKDKIWLRIGNNIQDQKPL